ncbi:MAG: WYL domain-containing protein [Actinobacteria bacterium]|jgi:proteasome accessory factor C|nr:WYL domain-containing protein [Actinomycetota bacterium]NBO34747.1 WYL domain-containing protein [Actinomycetota bacterium]
MANDLELLIRLLPWLVANNGASLREISSHFAISEKHALELIGQLVVTGPSQAGGGLVDIDFEDADSIFVSDAKSLDRPVKLSEFEASTLLGGLHYLEQFPNLVKSEVVTSLIQKIQQALPNVDSPINVVAAPISVEVRSVVTEAISSGKSMEITYAGITKDDVSVRLIDPVSTYSQDDFVYLKSWCQNSQAWRSFRLDRIVSATLTNEPRTILTESEPTEAKREYLASIELDKAYYGQLDQVDIISFKEYMWHAVEVELRVYSRDWLVSMILASGGRVKAISPPDLISALVERANAWE